MSEIRAAIVTRGIAGDWQVDCPLAAAGSPVGSIARDEAKLQAVAAGIVAAGGRAVFRAIDVTDAEATMVAASSLAEEPRAQGTPVGLLVNAAGRIDREVALWEADPRRVARDHRDEPRRLVQRVARGDSAHARGGECRQRPNTDNAQYCRVVELASGAGAKDWAKAWPIPEQGRGGFASPGICTRPAYALGLRAFAVAPGTVRTDMTGSMELHQGRKEFDTWSSWTTDLVLAIHRGELDAWSGKYLRVTHDSPESLASYEREHGAPAESARRLAITPWGDGDPECRSNGS